VTAAGPVRIVPLRLEAAAPAAAPRLTYRGGPLLESVEVFEIYWGDAWTAHSDLVAQLEDFFERVVASSLMDQLAEYGVPGHDIGHGTHRGSTTVSSPTPPSTVSDAEIRTFLDGQISSNASVPRPGPTLYFVFLAPGVSVGMDGASSCVNFCGYHDASGGGVYYAVMPYPDCPGCEGGMALVDALTATSSHELCEAITDPVPGSGWYDDANGEIGDICAWQTKRVDGHVVQLEWSNRQGRCT
jgi:hypothetical protein